MRKNHWAVGCSLIYLTAIACQSAAGTKYGVGGSGGPSVGGHSAAGRAGTGGGPTTVSETLTLTAVSAQVDGRAHNRVRFTISGTQTVGALASVGVTSFDSTSNAIAYFDMDTNGSHESATGYFVPHPLPNEATFSFDLVVPISSELADWKTAEVFLSDRSDAVSNTISVDIQPQPERAEGDACDPMSKTDRCVDGLECSSASSTCVSHQRPSLTQVGYYTTDTGPLLIARGTDALDDLLKIEIDFLDSNGSPVPVNITNDTTNPTMISSFDETGGIRQLDGTFVFQISPTPSFTELVKQVSLIPIDKQSLRGAAQTANLVAQPSKGNGAPCDAAGFNYCSGYAACVPGTEGASNACLPIGSAQSTVCKAAPIVAPSEGLNIVTGYTIGSSLWEPPTSCVPDTAQHNPEFVAKLHLDKATPSVTLSTARRETQIDTVLYVISACSPTSTQFLGCNDDSPSGGASLLTLSNLPAGDYYVIVDSRIGAEGSVGLEVTSP